MTLSLARRATMNRIPANVTFVRPNSSPRLRRVGYDPVSLIFGAYSGTPHGCSGILTPHGFSGGPMLRAGDRAPDFQLTTGDGNSVHLADLKGKPVVLYFYPRDDT